MKIRYKNVYLLTGIIFLVSLTACGQLAVTSTPNVEYQDVSLSLATVSPEEYLHHFEYDRSQPLDIQIVRSWRSYNVTVTELSFTSPRGGPVPALLFEPDGEGPFPGLVLMHGAPGQKENFKDWGVCYARYGFVAIAIDAPQFRSEHNTGHVSMALIWPRFDEKDLEEQSQLIVDLQRAVDLLLSLEKVDSERLVYIGGSYGGAMGGLFAGVETRLKAYVFKVGDGGIVEHLSEPDERGYPVTLERWVNILWPIEPLHYVGRAAPAELLFQNGVTDSYVPASDALRYQQAGSEPKSIIWYNEGHFLPMRYYYDHLMWLHERIGADTVLLKPYFSLSGLVYDRLLLVWFISSVFSLLFVTWDTGMKSHHGWIATLPWSFAILFLGPVGLISYLKIKRNQDSTERLTPANRALSESLWVVTTTMIGIVIVEQINFITVFHWRLKLLLYFTVPQIITIIVLICKYLRDKQTSEDNPFSVNSILSYLFISTAITSCAFLLISLFGRWILHFSFPIYNPLYWFAIMLGSILALTINYPFLLWLRKLGVLISGTPTLQPEPSSEEGPAFQWYKMLGLIICSYAVLFFIQAVYITTFTPIYISYIDAVKMMLGFTQ
jgi:dienelactone hydrolase